jgi:hypothetical protein
MELRNARLCLDCEEVHEESQCPICGSETFTFMTRWVPAAESRRRPRPHTSQEAEVYRQLISPGDGPSRGRRLLRSGVVGLTALGVAGLFWGSRSARHTGRTNGGDTDPES